jgi:hypothetical protein
VDCFRATWYQEQAPTGQFKKVPGKYREMAISDAVANTMIELIRARRPPTARICRGPTDPLLSRQRPQHPRRPGGAVRLGAVHVICGFRDRPLISRGQPALDRPTPSPGGTLLR